ncbi:uncharacterized protein LOC129169542 isoform X1 [Dunckerocampus dactyliophorus]|uniref:uncharacterized protein LOC129169542 isoform X1 n=1 Tax=Dunckerocampus dactyliophorus TaxID=161453 RepID=UPI002404CE8A|nr:uncharacterized protein LOC129169542 isoform X1 [Dunckerocampus dactyliophorus]
MSSTSQKHKDFVVGPIGDKPVSALAGIGEVLGERLEDKGFDKPCVVVSCSRVHTAIMSSTYQKHEEFLADPRIGEKPVTALPGIRELLGKRLEEKGVRRPRKVSDGG